MFEKHPDWLVKNATGQPIHAGTVEDDKDSLFVLDTTDPDAQEYLRKTYSTLVNEWGVHYIKMDFMDDAGSKVTTTDQIQRRSKPRGSG